jgi:hypothetical protein
VTAGATGGRAAESVNPRTAGRRPMATAKVVSFLCLDPMRYTGQILNAGAVFAENKLT